MKKGFFLNIGHFFLGMVKGRCEGEATHLRETGPGESCMAERRLRDTLRQEVQGHEQVLTSMGAPSGWLVNVGDL